MMSGRRRDEGPVTPRRQVELCETLRQISSRVLEMRRIVRDDEWCMVLVARRREERRRRTNGLLRELTAAQHLHNEYFLQVDRLKAAARSREEEDWMWAHALWQPALAFVECIGPFLERRSGGSQRDEIHDIAEHARKVLTGD